MLYAYGMWEAIMQFLRALAFFFILIAGNAAQAGVWQALSYRGEQVLIYSAGPVDAPVAVVLVHDWFGLTDQTQEAVDHFAALGIRAAAVELYHGEAAETHQEAWALMQALDASEAAHAIDGAIDYMGQNGASVGLMGFSMGVPHAIDAARRNSARVSAVAVWYGDTDNAYGESGPLGVPILGIFGAEDGNAAEQAAALEAGVTVDGGTAETLVYPGVGHAFAQPLFNGGDNFDEDATEASWALTQDFFARHLR